MHLTNSLVESPSYSRLMLIRVFFNTPKLKDLESLEYWAARVVSEKYGESPNTLPRNLHKKKESHTGFPFLVAYITLLSLRCTYGINIIYLPNKQQIDIGGIFPVAINFLQLFRVTLHCANGLSSRHLATPRYRFLVSKISSISVRSFTVLISISNR